MMRARIGLPYVTVTLVMLAVGVVWITLIDRPAGPRPLRAASPRAGVAARPVPAAPVTAGEVLSRADVLGLTAGQRAQLASLAGTWERDITSLEDALNTATEEFSRFAREAQQAGRTRLHDVRSRTEDVQSLSALVRERRIRHAGEALALLTASQRARITDSRQTTEGTR
jgi:hypothetical protein